MTSQPIISKKDQILSHFSCRKSGNCCKAGGYVPIRIPEIQAMADFLGIGADEFRRLYIVRHNGWEFISTPTHRVRCFLNENDQCSVYPARPIQCRTYPDWPEIWQSEESLSSEATQCPGLRRAIQTYNDAIEGGDASPIQS